MRAMHRKWRGVLYRLSGRLPLRVIHGDLDEPYLERYFLFRVPTPFGPVQGYLHRFVASDPDRGLHDHPWNRAISLVLAGGYTEQRFAHHSASGPVIVERRVGPGRLNILRGGDFHRVLIVARPDAPASEAWSLFVHGRYVKPWGFLRGDARQQGERVARIEYRPAESSSGQPWWRSVPRGDRHSERVAPR